MSNNTNINLTLTTKSKMAKDSLHDLSNSFVKLGKDGKRANNSIVGLVTSLGGLNTVIKGIGLYKLSQGFAKATQSGLDMRESIHMYNIAMGEFAESTGESIDKLSQLTGLDRIKLADTIGEYNLLARSMGLTAKNASILSENTNRLALDLSALTNRSIVKVQEDLRSGLIGQSKTMYKYGIDVTEAAIKQEALNMGISKSVRHMSQGEKMALRYSVMIRQAGLSHGDFANTINEPANQLRILSDRFLTLTRAIGSIFIPMVTRLLPYLNAILMVLIKIIQAIALLVGYDKEYNESFKNTDNSGFGIDDIGESADSAGKKVDKLKKKLQALAGFDEINIIGQNIPDSPSGGSGVDGVGGALDIDLSGYDSLISQIESKADAIAKNIENNLAKIVKFLEPTTKAFKSLWDNGLSLVGDFVWHGLKSFYNDFLVPISKWTVGTGLPRFAKITEDMLKRIDWDRLKDVTTRFFQSLEPFAETIGEGLLIFYEEVLVPLFEWAMETVFPEVLELLIKWMDAISIWVKENPETFEKLIVGLSGLWLTLKGLKVLKLVAELDAVRGLLGLFGDLIIRTKDVDEAFKDKNKSLDAQTQLTKADAKETSNLTSKLLGLAGAVGLVGLWLKENPIKIPDIKIPMPDWNPVYASINGFITQVGVKYELLKVKTADKLKSVENVITTSFQKAYNDVTTSKFGTFITNIGSNLGTLHNSVGTSMTNIGNTLSKNWGNGLVSANTFLTKAIPTMLTNVNSFGSGVATTFSQISKGMAGNFGEGLKASYNGFRNFGNSSLSTMSSFGSGMLKIAGDIGSGWVKNIVSGLKTAWNNIKDFAKTAGETLSGVYRANESVIKTTVVAGAVVGGAVLASMAMPALIPYIATTIGGMSQLAFSGAFARGGFPDKGSMFLAGENGAELIGSYGGKTTVMPLEDSGFVEAMRDAVYSAVVSASGGNNGGIIIQIGERTILDTMTDGVNRENRINGKSIITV